MKTEVNQKAQLMQYAGSIQQLAFIRRMEYGEGRASGMKAYDIKNGDIRFSVLADKCLDIGDFSYKGMNINFLSKPGLQGRNHYDTHGQEAQRSIMGGLLFTCGLENIGAPCSLEGKEYPMHGRMRTTPAEHLSADARWHQDRYELSVSGEMREAELFGENMVLRRVIRTCYGEKSIVIEDEIENQSFGAEPLMLLYHFNIGYPLLDEHVRIYLPVQRTIPRDPHSETGMHSWDRMEEPKAGVMEYVFWHELAADEKQNTMVMLVNEEKELGVCFEFNQRFLPYFYQWKSIAAGDYVIGFEPANSSIYGRAYHSEHHNTHLLGAFEKENVKIRLTIVDSREEIERCKRRIQELKKS